MSSIAAFANDLLGFFEGTDIIKAIDALQKGWPVDAMPDDAKTLLATLEGGAARLERPDVQAVLNTLPPSLRDKSRTLLTWIKTIRDQAETEEGRAILRLFSRVDRFTDDSDVNAADDPGLIRWQPLDVATSGNAGSLTFEAGASAGIEFEAGDLWPFRADSASDPGLSGLVRIQVDGAAKAGAGATLPLSVGSIGLSAKASADASLAWYVTPSRSEQLYLETLLEALPGLPLPTRFDALWKAFQTTNLKGVVMAIDGQFVMGAQIALASLAPIGGVGGLTTAVAVKARIERANAFQLSARAIGKPGSALPRPVVVTLTNARSRETTLGVDFGITLDATDLREKLAGIVRNVIDQWDDLLKPLEKYLSPGSFIRDSLAAELDAAVSGITGNAGLKTALKAEARRGLGLEPDDADLAGWVRDAIIDAVSSEADKVHAAATDAAGKIATRIAGTGLGTAAANQLRTRLDALLETYEQTFSAEVQGIATKAGGQLASLLARLGGKVTDAVTTLDQQLAAVRALLARFNALLARIQAATEDKANSNLQIAFSYETVSRQWSEFLFAGTFRENNPDVQKLFAHLMAGRADIVAGLLSPGAGPAGFELDTARSFALRGASWKDTMGFSLIIIGFEISNTLILTAEAQVRATADGVVVTGKAGAEAIDRRRDGTQIVTFTNPYRLSIDNKSDPAIPVVGVNLEIDRFEKDLTEGELFDFLGALVANGLLPESTRIKAADLLRQWRPLGGGATPVPGRVEIGFMLDGEDVARLYRRSERVNGDLPQASRIAIADICWRSLLQTRAITKIELERGLGLGLALVTGEPDTTSTAERLLYLADSAKSAIKWSPPSSSVPQRDQSDFDKLVWMFGGRAIDGRVQAGRLRPLIDALDAMGDLSSARPPPFGTWDEDDYRRAFGRVSTGASVWLGGNQRIDKLDDTIRPQLVAFMLVIRALAQLPPAAPASSPGSITPAAPLYLALSRGKDGKEDRTVIV